MRSCWKTVVHHHSRACVDHGLRGCCARKSLLQAQHLKAQLLCCSATMSSNMFGGEKLMHLTPRTLLFCCQWFCCCKESKWNNEGGAFSPNSSGKPKIISKKIVTWMQLGVLTGHCSQTSKLVKEWLNQARFEVLEWSSQNSDLNPLENI